MTKYFLYMQAQELTSTGKRTSFDCCACARSLLQGAHFHSEIGTLALALVVLATLVKIKLNARGCGHYRKSGLLKLRQI